MLEIPPNYSNDTKKTKGSIYTKFQVDAKCFNGRKIYPFNKGLQIYWGVYHPPFVHIKN